MDPTECLLELLKACKEKRTIDARDQAKALYEHLLRSGAVPDSDRAVIDYADTYLPEKTPSEEREAFMAALNFMDEK